MWLNLLTKEVTRVSKCVCVCSQHGYVEEEPDQRGLFPSSFVQMLSDWRKPTPDRNPDRHRTRPHQNMENRNPSSLRRTRSGSRMDSGSRTTDLRWTRSDIQIWSNTLPPRTWLFRSCPRDHGPAAAPTVSHIGHMLVFCCRGDAANEKNLEQTWVWSELGALQRSHSSEGSITCTVSSANNPTMQCVAFCGCKISVVQLRSCQKWHTSSGHPSSDSAWIWMCIW